MLKAESRKQGHEAYCLFCPLQPNWRKKKLVLYILARDYSGNRPSKPCAKSEFGVNPVMYDVY
jgi:hypothetical protein